MKISEILTVIAANIASAERQKKTGSLTFEVNMNRGKIGRCYITAQAELKPLPKGQPLTEAQGEKNAR